MPVVVLSAVVFCMTACKSVSPVPASHDVRVAYISGNASCSNDKGGKKVEVGQILQRGDHLVTGPDGCVDLAVAGLAIVRVKSASRLTISKFKLDPNGAEHQIDFELALDEGEILGSVKKLAATSKFVIKFPTGVIGVRGTTFAVETTGNCHVLDGAVVALPLVHPDGAITENFPLKQGTSLRFPTKNAMPVVYDTPAIVARAIREELKVAERHGASVAGGH